MWAFGILFYLLVLGFSPRKIFGPQPIAAILWSKPVLSERTCTELQALFSSYTNRAWHGTGGECFFFERQLIALAPPYENRQIEALFSRRRITGRKKKNRNQRAWEGGSATEERSRGQVARVLNNIQYPGTIGSVPRNACPQHDSARDSH